MHFSVTSFKYTASVLMLSVECAMKVAIVPVTAYQQNCSLILCEETHAVAAVDPGGDIEQLEAQIKEMGGKLAVVLLTRMGTWTIAHKRVCWLIVMVCRL
jgi:hypothetical protein